MMSDPFLRRLVLLGTPLVLAVVMLWHPSPYSDIEGELVPIAGWWLLLHTIQFVLFAFMGVAVWMLTEGLRGIAATVSRVAAVTFAVFYDIGDAIAGISTGILARGAANLPATERASIVPAIEILFQSSTKNLVFTIGILGWSVALAAALVALFWAGAPRVPLFLMALPIFFIGFDHAFPFGSLTFASFFLVALWLELDRTKKEHAREQDNSYPALASETDPR